MNVVSFVEQFASALVGGGVLALGGWHFQRRRLHLVLTTFPRADLTDHGKAVMFTVINRGLRNEEGVEIDVDPTLRYTLLAASTNGVECDGKCLRIARLPSRSDVNAMLLIEGGEFSRKTVLQLSSAGTKGKIHESLQTVPPQLGSVLGAIAFLGVMLIGGVFFFNSMAPDLLGERVPQALKPQAQRVQEGLEKIGWTDVLGVDSSPLFERYRVGEFPVSLRPVRREGGMVLIEVAAENHDDQPFTVSVYFDSVAEAPYIVETSNVMGDFVVQPGTAAVRYMKLSVPKSKEGRTIDALVSIDTHNDKVFAKNHVGIKL